ncbi:hypothetical protein KCP69_05460 [Salmonella enterica subsp. enterica]|nr:hypothetical protein KCP69_05460 [Salmonella enterica subsp. enterica]
MTGEAAYSAYLIMVDFISCCTPAFTPHAALAETVEGAVAIKRPQLKVGNGVLPVSAPAGNVA